MHYTDSYLYDHILEQEDGKRRYCDTVLQMTKAFALCGTLDEALQLSPEVAFHQAVRAPLVKGGSGDAPLKIQNLNFSNYYHRRWWVMVFRISSNWQVWSHLISPSF